AERAAKGAWAFEADLEADIRCAEVGLPQQEHRTLDTAALEVTMRRFAERGPEDAREVRLRHMSDAGQGGDVQRLRVGTVHRIACSEHAAIGLFCSAAHNVITAQFRPSITDPATISGPVCQHLVASL